MEDLIWKDAPSFKKYFHLKRTDPIPVEKFSIIQSRLPAKYCLMTSGDFTYAPTDNRAKSKHIIHLNINLEKGHCNLLKNNKDATMGILVRDVSTHERKPMVYDVSIKSYKINAGKGNRKMTVEEFKSIHKTPFGEYVCIKKDCKTAEDRDETLEEFYDHFIRYADILKVETKGKINIICTYASLFIKV